jgi:hypothetical protein
MATLTKTIKNKTIYLKSYQNGVIESTENKDEAKQFESKDAANQFAKQDLSTLTWRAE